MKEIRILPNKQTKTKGVHDQHSCLTRNGKGSSSGSYEIYLPVI
jgi:hypothetical protein